MSIEIIPTGAALGAGIRGVGLARPIDDDKPSLAALGGQFSSGVWAATRDRKILKRRWTGPRGPRACTATRAPSPKRNSSSASSSGSRSPASRQSWAISCRNRLFASSITRRAG